MAQPAVATKVHQAFDVNLGITAQIAFYHQVCINIFAHFQYVSVRKFVHPAGAFDSGRFTDFYGGIPANAVDIRQGDLHLFMCWDVNPCNTCQIGSPFLFAVP